MGDVLAKEKGGDQVVDWTSLSAVGAEGKGVEPSLSGRRGVEG